VSAVVVSGSQHIRPSDILDGKDATFYNGWDLEYERPKGYSPVVEDRREEDPVD
jgi:hypothetical protein